MVSEKIKRCNRSALQSGAYHFKIPFWIYCQKQALILTTWPVFTFPAGVKLLIHHLNNSTQVTIIFCRIKMQQISH
jgi:hypothetical protein